MITTVEIPLTKESNFTLFLPIKVRQMLAAFIDAFVVMCTNNLQQFVEKYFKQILHQLTGIINGKFTIKNNFLIQDCGRAAHFFLSMWSAIRVEPFLLKYIVSTKPCFVRLTGQGLVIVFTRQILGLLFWPFSLQNAVSPIYEWEYHNLIFKQLFKGRIVGISSLKGVSDRIVFDSKY